MQRTSTTSRTGRCGPSAAARAAVQEQKQSSCLSSYFVYCVVLFLVSAALSPHTPSVSALPTTNVEYTSDRGPTTDLGSGVQHGHRRFRAIVPAHVFTNWIPLAAGNAQAGNAPQDSVTRRRRRNVATAAAVNLGSGPQLESVQKYLGKAGSTASTATDPPSSSSESNGADSEGLASGNAYRIVHGTKVVLHVSADAWFE